MPGRGSCAGERSSARSGSSGRNPAASAGVLYLLLVLLFAGVGWFVSKVAGRHVWDAARTALLLLLILLVIQIVGAATAGGADVAEAVGRVVGTALIPLALAAWLSKRFQAGRSKAAQPLEGAESA